MRYDNSGNKIRCCRGKVGGRARNCVTLTITIRPVGISDRIPPYPVVLNLPNRKRMPAGPGWPGSGLVVAVVSLFGVGPGWYRFRGGFARLCVWVGPVWYHFPHQRPIFFFFFLDQLIPRGDVLGFFLFFFRKISKFLEFGGATPNAPKKGQIKRQTVEIARRPANPGCLRGGFI